MISFKINTTVIAYFECTTYANKNVSVIITDEMKIAIHFQIHSLCHNFVLLYIMVQHVGSPPVTIV